MRRVILARTRRYGSLGLGGPIAAVFVFCCAAGMHTPEIAGTWSGAMELEFAPGQREFMRIELALERKGETIRGRWHAIESAKHQAEGELVGSIVHKPGIHQVDATFTFAGYLRASATVSCAMRAAASPAQLAS